MTARMPWSAAAFRSRVSEADRARDQKSWAEAARLYQEAVRLRPKSAHIWMQLGHAQKEQEQYRSAATSYATALGIRSDDPEIHVQLGHLAKVRRRPDDALQHYIAALHLGSTDPHAREYVQRHGTAPPDASAMRSPAPAAEHGDLSRDQADTHLHRGNEARAEERWRDARRSYAAYLDAHPNDFHILVQYGHMCKEAGDLDAAEAAYVRAFRITPQDPDLQLQLGHLMKRFGYTQRALGFYQRALQLDPSLSGAGKEIEYLDWRKPWR